MEFIALSENFNPITKSYTKWVLQGWIILSFVQVFAQEMNIDGVVKNQSGKALVQEVRISLEGTVSASFTNKEGRFSLRTKEEGNKILHISAKGYKSKRLPLLLEGKSIDLGEIRIESSSVVGLEDNRIVLTEAQLLDNDIDNESFGVLSATKDIYLNAAAFDFGQLYFRVRGYDSRENMVLINGVRMNKLTNGRPEWNNWGGLNDVIRNRLFAIGLQPSSHTFGGLQGTTQFDTRPSLLRAGLRLSSSISNRTYSGRIMGTYTKHNSNRLAYSFSASKRFAYQGYVDGTFFDSSSLFGSIELPLGSNSSICITSFLVNSKKGSRAPITKEVYNLLGGRYNPYWGYQNNRSRSSRERLIKEPVFILNYTSSFGKLELNFAASYQFGYVKQSRLGYYNAPNPDPVYYRNLPSFFVNSPIGASFENAHIAEKGFVSAPQLAWNRLYRANSPILGREKASYIFYYDTNRNSIIRINKVWNYTGGNGLVIDTGVSYEKFMAHNYAEIADLMGAKYHIDRDPFSNSSNDLKGNLEKVEGDIFNYSFDFNSQNLDLFSQLRWSYKKWHVFVSGNYNWRNYQRFGRYQNERYLQDSEGESEKIEFRNPSGKIGITYFINGRQWLNINGINTLRAPILRDVFVNPRENNKSIKPLKAEKVRSIDFNYFFRFPSLMGRITGYYTRYQDLTNVSFYYVDSGLGSDFVQEVLTNHDKLQMGLELGLRYKLSSDIATSVAMALGKHVYANDPNLSINFDTFGNNQEIISSSGTRDLGKVGLKGYKIPTGPQMALSYSLEYRSPKYWWVNLKANFFANNYSGISLINRTNSFFINPKTGNKFENINQDRVKEFLNQEVLEEVYMINLVGGKSWLLDGKYVSVFVSINNLLDSSYRSGGFEQSRNGNYGQFLSDTKSDRPSFGPKYWYGFGRTFFINFSISL